MSESPDAADELRELLAALREDAITDAQAERLTAMLRDDPEARRMYLRYMAITAYLHGGSTDPCAALADRPGALDDRQRSVDDLPAAVPCPPIVIQTSPGFPSTLTPLGSFMFSYAAAAVIVGIGLLIGWAYQVSISRFDRQEVAIGAPRPTAAALRPEPEMVFVGRVTGMVDCRWADPETEPFNGARVPSGRKYALAAGLMEITYDAGAKVILQGPCTYEVESAHGGYLSVGRLTAKVEKRGEGRGERKENLANRQFVNGNPRHPSPPFSVRTPTAIVTDLGTEFGVEYDKSGVTRSLVFRGSVALQAASADGTVQGSARVLHENQSARVEKIGVITGGGLEVALGPSAKPGDFVRKMPKRTVKVFDLVDVVAGGDGFSGRRNRGIDPASGQVVETLPKESWKVFANGDGKYHRVKALPFLDGVFIPDGRVGRVQVDSAGHVFTGFPNTGNRTFGYIWAGGVLPGPAPTLSILAQLGGIDFASSHRRALYMHANKAVTFDLDAVRRANPNCKLIRFCAVAGNAAPADAEDARNCSADLWVLVDGKSRFQRRNIHGWNVPSWIGIPLSEQDHFLTLAATDGGDDTVYDWTLFGDPVLEVLAVEKK